MVLLREDFRQVLSSRFSTSERDLLESSEAFASALEASKYSSRPRTNLASEHISTIRSKQYLKICRP